MRTEMIELTGADGLCLRVEFLWRGDRFEHVISAVELSGETIPLLESMEGTSADNWPSSPPLQSLSVERLPDGRRAALLVGMAGGSHWSASIEPIPGVAELFFDLACRHSRQPNWLGSRYRHLSDSARTLVIRAGEASVFRAGETIKIEPVSLASSATTRWNFFVCLQS